MNADVRRIRMKFSISLRVLFILTLVAAVLTICTLRIIEYSTPDWSICTARQSLTPNPGFILLKERTEIHLADLDFESCERPESLVPPGTLPICWYRCDEHPGIYAYVYADPNYYTAAISVAVNELKSSYKTAKDHARKLEYEIIDLYDEELHELQTQ